MQNMRILVPIAFALLLFATARPMRAQGIDPSTPPPPPPPEEPVAPPPPAFDPYHAQKDVEVGTFYMKNGHYDAAIDRFEEATRLQPALALPWRLMGECYEKKHDDAHALISYKKYLEVFPRAKDADEVKKRITALEEKTPQQASKPASP
jgi:tetratricopeptide (TPR) repeat protein